MRRSPILSSLTAIALALGVLLPFAAQAALIDAKLVPDGTYVVHVEHVDDLMHITVVLNNGMETRLAAGSHTDFSKVRANQTLKISVIQGHVPVYIVEK